MQRGPYARATSRRKLRWRHAPSETEESGRAAPIYSDTADNEDQIRTLIERWAEAVRAGDMDGVLADHAHDIVMLDVPPPYEGERGIDA